ncbi:hypothetical protein PAMP_010349 [Pampus punctatissimus]
MTRTKQEWQDSTEERRGSLTAPYSSRKDLVNGNDEADRRQQERPTPTAAILLFSPTSLFRDMRHLAGDTALHGNFKAVTRGTPHNTPTSTNIMRHTALLAEITLLWVSGTLLPLQASMTPHWFSDRTQDQCTTENTN